MTYLNATASGQQWIANLHNHVFCAEHAYHLMGPQAWPARIDVRRRGWGNSKRCARAC